MFWMTIRRLPVEKMPRLEATSRRMMVKKSGLAKRQIYVLIGGRGRAEAEASFLRNGTISLR
jgi:hypothetical protein